MKTDDLFYKLLQTLPALTFELAGLPSPSIPYQFQSFELKDFGFRLDGLLLPVDPDPEQPIVLVEAQMQSDENLYYRIQAELSVYLYQYRPPNPWITVVIYPNGETERPIPHLDNFLAFGNIHRVYLDQLPKGGSFGMDLLRLVVQPPEVVEAEGRELVERVRQFEAELSRRCLELVTELMSRKFPERGEREIRQMLGLAELEQTKAYQEGLQEGRQEGRQEGLQEGRQEGLQEGRQEGLQEGQQQEASTLILRFLQKKLGAPNPTQRQQIQQLSVEQLEALWDRLLDADSTLDLDQWLSTQLRDQDS